jgi:tetratricopeptide (TPR) repeat protein
MKTQIIRNIALALPLVGALGCDDVTPPKRNIDATVTVEKKPEPPKTVIATPPPVVPKPPQNSIVKPEPRGAQETLKEARRLLNEGTDRELALKYARRAAKMLPDDFLAQNTLGRAEMEMNHGQEAQEAFQKAVDIKDESSFAHNNLGLTYIMQEKWDDALEEMEKATSLEPVKAYMWNNLGIVLEHLDRLDEARAAYQKAADGGAENAKSSVARLEGVKTIKISKAKPEKIEVPSDGGTH